VGGHGATTPVNSSTEMGFEHLNDKLVHEVVNGINEAAVRHTPARQPPKPQTAIGMISCCDRTRDRQRSDRPRIVLGPATNIDRVDHLSDARRDLVERTLRGERLGQPAAPALVRLATSAVASLVATGAAGQAIRPGPLPPSGPRRP